MSVRIPPGFDFTDPDLYVQRVPTEEFAELRRAAPVWWNQQPRGAGGFDDQGDWVGPKDRDIIPASRTSDIFSSWENTALIRIERRLNPPPLQQPRPRPHN